MRDQRRLDEFRKRLTTSSGPTQRTLLKSTWTIVRTSWTPLLSVTAVVISMIAAYYNVIRVEDNVSMKFVGWIGVYRDEKEVFVEIREADVAFINSGNRSAVITGMGLIVAIDSDCGSWDHRNDFGTNLTPFAIKEREVLLKRVAVKKSVSVKSPTRVVEDGKFAYPLEEQFLEIDEVPVQVCARVGMITPSIADYSTYVELADTALRRDGYVTIGSFRDDWEKPVVLIRQKQTVFGW